MFTDISLTFPGKSNPTSTVVVVGLPYGVKEALHYLYKCTCSIILFKHSIQQAILCGVLLSIWDVLCLAILPIFLIWRVFSVNIGFCKRSFLVAAHKLTNLPPSEGWNVFMRFGSTWPLLIWPRGPQSGLRESIAIGLLEHYSCLGIRLRHVPIHLDLIADQSPSPQHSGLQT